MQVQIQPETNNPANQSAPPVPYNDFSVDDLAPKRQTLWWCKHSAQVMLHLTNTGNCATPFQLAGQGEAADCSVEFELPTGLAHRAGRVEFELAAGQSITVPVRVILPFPPVIALRRQTYFFTVTVTQLAGWPQRRSLLGQVSRPPIVGPGLLLALVMAAVVRLLFAPYSLPLPQSQIKNNLPGSALISAESPSNPFVKPVYLAGNSPQNPFETGETAATEMTYREMFEEVAGQYNLDWQLLAEIAYQESRFNPWAIGRSNEMGLMQIHPVTWGAWAPRVGATDPYDPYSNVQVAAAFLAYLTNFCQSRGYSDPRCVLIGYNWGPSNLQKLFRENGTLEQAPEKPRQYANRILQLEPEAPIRRQAQLETPVVPEVASIR